jgi:hypothetical protein
MRLYAFCMSLSVLTTQALADDVRSYLLNPRTMTYELYPGIADGADPTAIEGYDNFRGSWAFPPGATNLNGRLRTGGNEVGDDIRMSVPGRGLIDRVGTTMNNFSVDGTVERFRRTWRWYNATDFTLQGELSFLVTIAGGLPPLTGGIFNQPRGFLAEFGIQVEQNVYFTVQYSEVVGVSINDIGQLYGGPINTGSSSRFIRDFTTGQMIDLGSDQQNLGLKIDFNPIPSPGAGGLLVVAGIWGLRRRR